MSELQVGDRVVTATALASDDWTPAQQARRHPGAAGVVRTIHAAGIGPAIYVIDHDAIERSGTYHGDELTPVRKRAALEQRSDIEERLSKLEAQHSRSLDAMARELNGLETSLEHCQDRLRVLEQQRDSEHIPRPAADKLEAEAAVAAARPWCEDLDREIRQQIMQDLRQEGRPRAADALGAVPDLVTTARAATVCPSELQALRAVAEAAHQLSCLQPEVTEPVGRLNDALQALDELDADEEQPSPYAGAHDDSGLDVRLADDSPEAPAPPPSDACREIERLQEQVHLQCAEIDQLRGEVAERRRRDDDPDALVARLEQTTQAVRHLTCAPETVSLHDALEAARWQAEEYGNAESALRAELGGTGGLADLAKEAVIQIRGGTAGILLYRRLSDPEAYNEPDPDKLAAAALIARTSQQKQAEVLSDLREIFGADEAGFGLRELATRAVLHAEPVLRLLETYSAVEIDGFRGGLVSVIAGSPSHGIAQGVTDMLAQVLCLAEPKGDQS